LYSSSSRSTLYSTTTTTTIITTTTTTTATTTSSSSYSSGSSVVLSLVVVVDAATWRQSLKELKNRLVEKTKSLSLCEHCEFCYQYCCYVYSAKQQTMGEKSPQSNYVRIYSNGTCMWWPMFEESVSHCPIDVTWYPFDYQKCNLSFESWKYNKNMLNITAKHLPKRSYQHYIPDEEWKLLGRHRRYTRTYLLFLNQT